MFHKDKITQLQGQFDVLLQTVEQQASTIKDLTEAISTQKEREELVRKYKEAGGVGNYTANMDAPIISQVQEISGFTFYYSAGITDDSLLDSNAIYSISDFRNKVNAQIAKQHEETYTNNKKKKKNKTKKGQGK